MAKRNAARRAYRFTGRRRSALKKAQLKSAQKRKGGGGKALVGIGMLAGVGAAAYLGYHHRGTIAKKAGDWRKAVQPKAKEATLAEVNKAVRGAPITANDRIRADTIRAGLAAPRPDRRIYDEDDNVDSETMTNRAVAAKLRKARKRTSGRKTRAKITLPAQGKFSEQQWRDALGFDINTRLPKGRDNG